MERAIEYEVDRQIGVIESGGRVAQETRLYDPDKGETRPMRQKEEANDYRYFPDPDLLPLVLDSAYIEARRDELPELPDAKRQRFMADFDLSAAEADQLCATATLADYFEVTVAASGGQAKLSANWVNGELTGALNKAAMPITESPVDAQGLGGLLKRIADQTISGKIAKQVFEAMWAGEGDADVIIEARGLKQITDSGELDGIIDRIIADNPKQVGQFRAGKAKVMGFFVGQVMKQTAGKANPQQVNTLLKQKLSSPSDSS